MSSARELCIPHSALSEIVSLVSAECTIGIVWGVGLAKALW